MIRINLLPGKRRKKAAQFDSRFIPGIVFGVLAAIVMVIYFVHLNNRITSIQADKVVKEKKLAEIKEKIKEVEGYEKDNELFRLKNKVIEQLKAQQGLPLRMLDEVSALMPDGIWLTSLVNKGNQVNLEGYAFTNPNLVNYIQNLKGSEYMVNVTLLESKRVKFQQTQVYKFKLTFGMKI